MQSSKTGYFFKLKISAIKDTFVFECARTFSYHQYLTPVPFSFINYMIIPTKVSVTFNIIRMMISLPDSNGSVRPVYHHQRSHFAFPCRFISIIFCIPITNYWLCGFSQTVHANNNTRTLPTSLVPRRSNGNPILPPEEDIRLPL